MPPPRSVDRSAKRLVGRSYQLKTGHCPTGQYLQWTKKDPRRSAGGAPTRCRHGGTSSKTAPAGSCSKRIRDLFADERCTQPIPDFLRPTKVGRRTGPKEVGRNVEQGEGNDEGSGREEGVD
jgi:hypothetical protein